MSRAAAVLAEHVGHRTVVRDASTLRCVDCSHTLLLGPVAGRSVLTDEDRLAHVEATPEPCPHHVGELARSCRCCAADAKAAQPAAAPAQRVPVADVARWAAACRAALPSRRRP